VNWVRGGTGVFREPEIRRERTQERTLFSGTPRVALLQEQAHERVAQAVRREVGRRRSGP